MNLYVETTEELECQGYTWEDVAWMGREDTNLLIWPENFETVLDIEYDGGFGCQEIIYDLVIKMKDGTWFERNEYDGSEWWAYRTPPRLNIPATGTVELTKEQIKWRS